MFILFLIASELLLLQLYLSVTHYYVLIFVALLYYVFWYNSGAEITGYESKNSFRSWSVWRSFTSVRYVWSNHEEFQRKRKLLFILTSNETNMSLISGFGLHGGIFGQIDVRYVVPSLLLSVPFLREFLLWSGAVAAPKNRDVEGVILGLLQSGKSVAYCPQTKDIPNDIFEFAKQNNVYLVPVLVSKEDERYYIPHGPWWITKIQQFSVQHFRYPLTRVFFPRIFGSSPPPKIELMVGVPMNPSAQEDAETFKKMFEGQINGFSATFI